MKQSTKKGAAKRAKLQLPKLSDPANVQRVLELLKDKTQSESARFELEEWLDELFADAGEKVSTYDRATVMLQPSALRVEQGEPSDAYRRIQETLARVLGGETLADIRRTEDKRRERARHAFLAKPEPADKLSDDWRLWKLRQWEAAIDNKASDGAKFRAAMSEFRAMLQSLADESGLHAADFYRLMSHVVFARQEIDRAQMNRTHLTTRRRNRTKGGRADV